MRRYGIIFFFAIFCMEISFAATFDLSLNLLPGLEVTGVKEISNFGVTGDSPNSYIDSASFGADGNIVAFESDLDVSMGPAWTIGVSTVLDDKIITETLAPEFRNPSDPRISPDGNRIIFIGLKTDATEKDKRGIYITDLKGNNIRRLTPANIDPIFPAWSPDGKMIAFSIQSDPENPDPATTLDFIDPEKPEIIQRTIHLTESLGGFRYSPDGEWIACGSDRGIGVINVKTGKFYLILDPATLTLRFSPDAIEPGAAFINWLPDSKRLLVGIGTIESSNQNKKVDQIFQLNLKGEAFSVGDGFLIGSTFDGKTLFVRQHGQNWRVDLKEKSLPADPIDLSLESVNGGMIKLPDYRGKVVVLNLWATWCTNCRRELPMLNDVQQEALKNGSGMRIIGITIDWDRQAVKECYATDKIIYTVGYANDTLLKVLGNIEGLPMKFILNKKGQIVDKIAGLCSREELEQRIAKYLK